MSTRSQKWGVFLFLRSPMQCCSFNRSTMKSWTDGWRDRQNDRHYPQQTIDSPLTASLSTKPYQGAIIFYGEGGRLFVIAGHQFFLPPPWHAHKNSGPPPGLRKKILVPPLVKEHPLHNNETIQIIMHVLYDDGFGSLQHSILSSYPLYHWLIH